ncbi:efflux RND transporter periplasmic adaptor subunit [Neorhizobium sp. JUb45]|uniref:efflux RND transporter periplasmic adaptor subunit n=1 Tax=Neorhizobium sp. JUb45 TaxID=2485113 RepID=UPI00104E02DF|nr:efflux RND transporter periplasmic adaptor subunit [Neorhizobium sp. JUb45]TCR06235.1 RND family efflux transporter MFP subunit [Neorhizobium sp. JUb45]
MSSFSKLSIGLVLASTLTILAGCSEEKKPETAEVLRPVKVAEIGAADEGRALVYSGSVRARKQMDLGFRVAGKITERLVDVGERVTPGTVLARLDAVDLQLAVRRAEADLASAEKQVEISTLARRRAENLASKNIAPQAELEQSVLAADQALSALQSAVSALEQARNQVAYAQLKSDVNGIVTGVSAEAGQVVAAGTTVISVAVDGEKEVEIAVPENDIAQFRPGKTVSATFWSYRDLTLEGKVREVSGSANTQSRTFMVRVSLPDDEQLRLGMTGMITARTDGAVAAYSVPLAAVTQKDGKSIVWIVDKAKGTVHARPVTVAGFSDDGVRIADGVKPGETVVAAGTQFMAEDMKVRVPGAATAEAEGNTQTAPHSADRS